MGDKDVKEKIIELVREYPIGALATIDKNRPWVRYIGFDIDDDCRLFAASYTESRKVDQIKVNHNVHVVFGLDPREEEKPFINYAGTARILMDSATRERFWQEMYGDFFSGPDDPNYAIIEVSPQLIEYYGTYLREPEIYRPADAEEK